jgi:hypothetical protein
MPIADWYALALRARERLSAHPDAFQVRWIAKKPASKAALTAVERKLGAPLPPSLRDLYTRRAAGLTLGWSVRRGHEERVGSDVHEPASGYLDIVAPTGLGRRLDDHGIVQFTNDGHGNGYAFRPGDERPALLWFDHDPADGEHVRSAGRGRLDAWFTAWARVGFGSVDDSPPEVARFFRTGKLPPLDDEPKATATTKPKAIAEAPKHKEQVWAVTAFPDGLRAASGSNDGTIHVFDVLTGARIMKLAADAGVYTLAASAKGDLLIAGGHRGFQVWNLKTGKTTRASNPRAGRVLDMALSQDERRLVTVGLGELAVWDLATGKKVASLEDHASSLALDSRGRAITFEGKRLQVWNLEKKKRERTITHAKMPTAFISRSLALDP